MEFPENGLDIQFNCDGWGPILGERVVAFDDIPYAHFDKKDKCWRHADFSVQGQAQKQYGRYHRPRGDDANAGNTEFSYRYDAAEDSTFKLVDTSKAQARKSKRNWSAPTRGGMRYPAGGRGVGGRGSGRLESSTAQSGRGMKSLGRGNGRPPRRNDRKSDRLPSLVVKGDWEVVEEIDWAQLLKLQTNLPKVDDLLWCGHLDQYDDTYDKASSKVPRPLRRIQNKQFYYVTTTDDPVLGRFILEGVGNVFATDAIIAHLMAASRSVYSWDIVIQKINGMLFLDKRDNSQFDFLTVSETANEPPQVVEEIDEINHPEKLSIEATMINQNFSQQILKDPTEGRKLVRPFFFIFHYHPVR
jgi:translation initiation factor 3 subunit D